ncbi:MAG TPA: chemotaxis protein CheB, partial [Terriglobales bacterium]|nr:chemotaxis protein CheB [Terriglobales bacterium]
HLPGNFPAPILLATHVPSDYPSILPQILSRSGPLPAFYPGDNEVLKPGNIYVARPDFHLLLDDGRAVLSRGPKENWHRPAIDPLFRSAARFYGPRVIGIVLSGQLDDGSAGLMAIKMRGGSSVVQDPQDALSPQMPQNAIRYAAPDYVVPVAEMPALLDKLLKEQVNFTAQPAEAEMQDEIDDEAGEAHLEEQGPKKKYGKPSTFACPECHGVLWELEEGGLLRFRCRVGHAFTADSLRLVMSDATEDALWAAMRALEEKAGLLRRLSPRSATPARGAFVEEAETLVRHAQQIRKMLVENQHFAQINSSDVSTTGTKGTQEETNRERDAQAEDNKDVA